MSEQSSDSMLDRIFSLGTAVAVPLVQRMVYGQQPGEAEDLERERMRLNSLNGSGPNNPAASIAQSPLTLQDFIGQSTRQTAPPAPTTSNTMLYVVVGAVALGLLFFLKK
jgi:hypothetical protein